MDTCRNARVWVDFFGGSHEWQNSWCKGEKGDNKEWELNYAHPFPRVSGYQRVSDIMEVDISEFRVYIHTSWLLKNGIKDIVKMDDIVNFESIELY